MSLQQAHLWLIKIFPKPNWFLFSCFFCFTLATKIKQANMISPPSRQLMMAVWQPHVLEGDFPLRWLFFIKPRTSFAELPQGTQDSYSRAKKDSLWSLTSGLLLLSFLCNAYPSWALPFMSWHLWWRFGDRSKCSLLSLNPHIFWSDTVKSWQLLVRHTVLYQPSWLQTKGK